MCSSPARKGYIDESDAVLLGTLERIPYVEAAAPRLSTAATMTISKNGQSIEEFRVPLTGVDPLRDVRASTIHETVVEGQYVFARNSMVLGAIVARDMGGAQVGDSIEVTVTDRWGQEQTRRFIVTGIARSPGGQGFDYTAIVHIDTLRDMLDRAGSSERIMVKLSDKSKALEVKNTFLLSFPHGDLEAQTIEEAAEQQLAGFRSGIAMINMIGYFGMMSSAFAILTIQMMLVNGKTREIGIMRSIGAMKEGYPARIHTSGNDNRRNRRICGNRRRAGVHILCKGDQTVLQQQPASGGKLQLGKDRPDGTGLLWACHACVPVPVVPGYKAASPWRPCALHSALEICNLNKVYGQGATKVQALYDVSFAIERGQFTLVVGSSGSGKSTLLNMIGLLDRPTNGQVFIDGIDTGRLSESGMSRFRNKKLGFVFQFSNLLADLTVLENVMLPSQIGGAGASGAKDALDLLRAVGMEGVTPTRRPTRYPGARRNEPPSPGDWQTTPPSFWPTSPPATLTPSLQNRW